MTADQLGDTAQGCSSWLSFLVSHVRVGLDSLVRDGEGMKICVPLVARRAFKFST